MQLLVVKTKNWNCICHFILINSCFKSWSKGTLLDANGITYTLMKWIVLLEFYWKCLWSLISSGVDGFKSLWYTLTDTVLSLTCPFEINNYQMEYVHLIQDSSTYLLHSILRERRVKKVINAIRYQIQQNILTKLPYIHSFPEKKWHLTREVFQANQTTIQSSI